MRTGITTTKHATRTILKRTNSPVHEFVMLCSKKLYLVLGHASYRGKPYTYVLLYLPREDRHYIGVLNGAQSIIVSVWKIGYVLPRKIPRLRRRQLTDLRCIVTDTLQFRS